MTLSYILLYGSIEHDAVTSLPMEVPYRLLCLVDKWAAGRWRFLESRIRVPMMFEIVKVGERFEGLGRWGWGDFSPRYINDSVSCVHREACSPCTKHILVGLCMENSIIMSGLPTIVHTHHPWFFNFDIANPNISTISPHRTSISLTTVKHGRMSYI